MPSSSQLAVKRRKGSRHDKNGCLTCRYRRKKCVDNTFPVCGTCLRLNLECLRDPVRTFPLPSQIHAKHLGEPLNLQPSSPLYISPSLLIHGRAGSSQRRHLIQYYMDFSKNLTIGKKVNIFVSALLPMAMESPALYNAILALAAGHLSHADAAYKVIALEAQSVAMKYLVLAILRPLSYATQHDINVAVCLVLLITEVRVGDCRNWDSYLMAAKQLILSTPGKPACGRDVRGPHALLGTAEGQWALRVFIHYDIMASVTLRRKPLLYEFYRGDSTSILHKCFPMTGETLVFIADIGRLDEETTLGEFATVEETEDKISLFYTRSSSLERRMEAWSCGTGLPLLVTAVAHAYQSAAFILVYRLMRNRLSTKHLFGHENLASITSMADQLQMKIRFHVHNILGHAGKVPFGTAIESNLLFPLFIAGGESTEDDQIDIIRNRLQSLDARLHFQNSSRALEVLEELWRRQRAHDALNADWSQVMTAFGGGLILA